ncbi:MAG: hypothetical protein RMJ84_04025, partial [Sandaracinaceae bacterium]|nr:hypothetical protein [Sandaracinaceae bacterium]
MDQRRWIWLFLVVGVACSGPSSVPDGSGEAPDGGGDAWDGGGREDTPSNGLDAFRMPDGGPRGDAFRPTDPSPDVFDEGPPP